MEVNVQELVKETGLNEPFYPGKRVVKPLPQKGEYKSHCVVYHWLDQSEMRIDIKAGLSGKDLEPKDLANYPVSFQAPTFVRIETEDGANDDEKEEEEGEEGRSGKGGGGKKPAKKKQKESTLGAFSKVVEGKLPDLGTVKEMVVMGKQIAEKAFGAVLETLVAQIKHAKIGPTNLLASSQEIVRAAPGGGLTPKGNETLDYKYDAEKNAPMFGGTSPS